MGQAADQIIDRLIHGLAHGIVERRIECRARHVVRRRQTVEQGMDALDIEDALSDQARPADLFDHRNHRRVGVGHRVVRRKRPYLTPTEDALREDRDEHRFSEQRARSARVVGSRRPLALQPRLQICDANLDAFNAHINRARSRASRVGAAWLRPRHCCRPRAPGRDGRTVRLESPPMLRCRAIENRS